MVENNKSPTVGENVKKYRRIRGLSQKTLAAEVKKITGKCTQQTINNIETGKILASSFLPEIALILDVNIERLDPTLTNHSQVYSAQDYALFSGQSNIHNVELPKYQRKMLIDQNKAPQNNLTSLFSDKKTEITLANDVPVYGTIDITTDGFYITDTPIDFITRPHIVKLEPDAFGIIIGVRNMEPAFRIDDIIIIHPRKMAKEGDLCLFSDKNHYIIGELVQESQTNWTIKQYNVAQNKMLHKETWKKCQVIVGRFF